MTDPARDAPAPGERGLVCISLAAPTLEALRLRLGEAEHGDVVELRLDALAADERRDGASLRLLLAACRCPAIVTCRPVDGVDEAGRHDLLAGALQAGAWAVDVELEADFAAALVSAAPRRVVLSHHATEARPENLDEAARRAAALQPAIVKLVAPAADLAGAAHVLAVGRHLRAGGQPAATFCLGEAARASRLLDFANGGALLYVAVDAGAETAEGQWPARWVRDSLRPASWRAGGDRFGLLGDPLAHSLSPPLFNLAFSLDGSGSGYLPVAGRSFGVALDLATEAGLRGLSITMPFKQQALGHCRADELAARIGAVNTLTRRNGAWYGSNTDGPAVREVLERHVQIAGSTVFILGAGGAARAAAVVLADAGARLLIANRSRLRAAALAAVVGGDVVDWSQVATVRADVAINATSAGMDATAGSALPTFPLRGDEVVMDMVYRPLHTAWVQQARERGCTAIPGLEMFLSQAASQYRHWTGEEPPLARWRAEAQSRLEDVAEGSDDAADHR